MKGNNAVKFILVVAVIGILTWIAAAGPNIMGFNLKGMWDIHKGVDIRGGVRATFGAQDLITSKDFTPDSKQMASMVAKIRTRLDADRIYDATLTPSRNNTRLTVEIPWAQNEKDFDPNAFIDKTIQPALLTFRYVDDKQKDSNGNYLPLNDKIILQGSDIKDASYGTDKNGQPAVELTMTSSAAKKFADATTKLAPVNGKPGGVIAIFMDNTMLESANVTEAITGGNAEISGNFTPKTAGDLAAKIRAGALPFKLSKLAVDSISSLLGENAFNVSVMAMGIALLLVWVFMLVKYRLMGILANIALLGHTVIQVLFISWAGITVTLPGIAGIILTIGMGVDANIIIFERIKEELRNGKTLRAAVDVGFKRAFSAVFDANMTTLISAVVLYMFNSGPIRSFAITLGLGVALSFVTAVVASRIMLKSIIDIDIAKHPWLYGVKLKDKEPKEVKA